MNKLKVFIKPFSKRLHIQPTFNREPIGRGFYYILIKLGFWLFLIERKPNIKINYFGKIEVKPYV